MWSSLPPDRPDRRMSPDGVQDDPCVPEEQSADRNLAAFRTLLLFLSLSLDLSFPPFLYPSELTLLRALSLSLYLTCGLANKNKTQNARRRGGAEAGRGCEWVVCVRVCEGWIFSAGQEVASSCAGHGPSPLGGLLLLEGFVAFNVLFSFSGRRFFSFYYGSDRILRSF